MKRKQIFYFLFFSAITFRLEPFFCISMYDDFKIKSIWYTKLRRTIEAKPVPANNLDMWRRSEWKPNESNKNKNWNMKNKPIETVKKIQGSLCLWREVYRMKKRPYIRAKREITILANSSVIFKKRLIIHKEIYSFK